MSNFDDRNQADVPSNPQTSRRSYLSFLGIGSLALGSSTVAAKNENQSKGMSEHHTSTHARNPQQNSLAEKFKTLSRGTEWQQVGQQQVNFDTYHPQGMSKVGDQLFLSSVEVLELPGRYTERDDDNDSPGRGIGHLFKMDEEGQLLDEIQLGKEAIYHPGGIDYDGNYLWVPVAEYRPDSRSIIYRVDPESMEATPMFRVADHIGGLIYNADRDSLYGVNWGSRTFYQWNLTGTGKVINQNKPLTEQATQNPEHYIDYQDCQYIGDDFALCSGVAVYQPPNASDVQLGGIDLVNLRSVTPEYQVPVPEWTDDGMVMTRNPFLAEERPNGLRFYFLPEDNTSHLFTYEVTTSQ
jgi:Family of unknown function (DUF6454)